MQQYITTEEIYVPADEPGKVYRCEGDFVFSLPEGTTLEDLKKFIPFINRVYAEGFRYGTVQLQYKPRDLLGAAGKENP